MPPISLENPSGWLYFSSADLQLARDKREDEPISLALALLESPPEDALSVAYLAALSYRFNGDIESGQAALQALCTSDFVTGAPSTEYAAVKQALGWLGLMAMLRDLPEWAAQESALLGATAAHIDALNHLQEPADLLREFWLGALNMAAGIILDSADYRERAAALYRRAVDQHIHPEGYLKGIVDRESSVDSYESQLSGTCALVILAEMAERAELDLWSYNNRAVTPITAATYTFYYYFYPEKWRWEPGLTRERTLASMRREGAFMELVNRRHALHGVEQLLAEQRPFFCPWAGGLTTLTHGLVPPNKKRWRLW